MLLGAVLLSSSIAADAAEVGCTQYLSPMLGHEVHYCVDRSTPGTPSEPGEPVAYFMHGTNGSAKTWERNNFKASLRKLREGEKLPPVTYVSFDTSAYSFFSDLPHKMANEHSQAYESWFTQEFIPYIEKNLQVCDRRECRAIMGVSMGGFGALKTALRHPELFSVIAVNSPALSPFQDRESFWKWVEYFTFKPIGVLKGFMLTKIFFTIFPNDPTFNENNPTRLISEYSAPEPFPELYFDMGGKDGYGFYDGYELIKDTLDEKRFPYSTIFEPAGHHDMWNRHALDSISFIESHLQQ